MTGAKCKFIFNDDIRNETGLTISGSCITKYSIIFEGSK